ncbi:unnamed protein product [Chrysoparadoxa australica]
MREALQGLRKAPKLTGENIKNLSPIAFCHMMSHVCAVIGLGAGAVSFVHVVKALEPLFTALMSAIFVGQILPLPVYAALLPVIGGVVLASLKERNFSWVAFGGAMGSNLAAASRGVLAKTSMDKPMGENMSAANLYGVLTILATIGLAPVAAIAEGAKFTSLWDDAIKAGVTGNEILKGSVLSGLFFYLYNEVAFLALSQVHPVTHAVGNTFKRVFVIVASVFVFKTEMTPLAITGSAIAILGVLVYSLVREHYANKTK